MRTLGIDLSASPKKTTACAITWTRGRAVVHTPVSGLDDQPLLDLIEEADWIGIDAPFGWPADFLEAVTQWAELGNWPDIPREQLRFRETDRFVKTTARLPLSVSSDRIAVTAMRCASLLTALGERRSGPGGRIDRSGDDHIVEVYPGAALPQWSDQAGDLRLDPQGYKGKENTGRRELLLNVLQQAAPWLRLDEATRSACVQNDDALDALLCSLVARAAAKNQTLPPATREECAVARLEGWIHLPKKGSLASLASD